MHQEQCRVSGVGMKQYKSFCTYLVWRWGQKFDCRKKTKWWTRHRDTGTGSGDYSTGVELKSTMLVCLFAVMPAFGLLAQSGWIINADRILLTERYNSNKTNYITRNKNYKQNKNIWKYRYDRKYEINVPEWADWAEQHHNQTDIAHSTSGSPRCISSPNLEI